MTETVGSRIVAHLFRQGNYPFSSSIRRDVVRPYGSLVD